MICQELQTLQQQFAALLLASDQQEHLLRQLEHTGEDAGRHQAARRVLLSRLDQTGQVLALHVERHNCAH